MTAEFRVGEHDAHGSTLLSDVGLVASGDAGHTVSEHAAAGHAAAPEGPAAMGGKPEPQPEPVSVLGTTTVAAGILARRHGGLTALRLAAAYRRRPRRDRRAAVGPVVPRRPGPTAGEDAGSLSSDTVTTASRSRPRVVQRALVRAVVAVLALVVLSVAGVLPAQLMRVGSDSMVPALRSGDLVVVGRWPGDVHRNDVVVTEPVEPGGDRLVKRAVALGGDTVAIEDGVLVVDGGTVCEPWSDPARLDGVWFGPVRVPHGHVFLLGDERNGSVDSRTFGSLDRDRVVGVVLARAWPLPGPVPATTC